jgi:WD40 repeat protein
MIRWLLSSLFFGALLAGAVIYFVGWPQDVAPVGQGGSNTVVKAAPNPGTSATQPGDPGGALRGGPDPVRLDAGAPANAAGAATRMAEIIIQEGKFVAKTTAEMPSEREGTLLFVATEVSPFDERHPEYRELFNVPENGRYELIPAKIPAAERSKYFVWHVPVVAILMTATEPAPKPSERVFPFGHGKGSVNENEQIFRRAREGDTLEPDRFAIFKEARYFKELGITDRVKEGDLLAVVNPALVFDELRNKQAALRVKVADRDASLAIRDEAKTRYDRQVVLFGKGATSPEERDGAKMNWIRYTEEAKGKDYSIIVAQQELSQTLTLLRMHFIRAKMDGTIMQIYKKKSEAVKSLEQVLQLHNLDDLLVEGQVGVQNLPFLKKGMVVNVEPSMQEHYLQVLPGHPYEINSVAVSSGRFQLTKSLVETLRSAGVPAPVLGKLHELEDKEIGDRKEFTRNLGRVLDKDEVEHWQKLIVSHANSPQIVSVSEDGSIRIWERTEKAGGEFQQVDMLGDAGGSGRPDSSRAVRCVACSPPGSADNLCVTGDNDGVVKLWDLAKSGKDALLMTSKAHKGSTVTCVAFHPSGDYFASGGDDRKIIMWHKNDGEWVQQYVLPEGHKGGVTSIQFAGANELVSAGSDKQLIRWEVREKAANQLNRFEHRSGDVATLGVSPDGSRVLFDRARELQLLSLAERRTVAVLQNSAEAASFNLFALFSPDGKMVLTGQGSEVRLQLWQLPREGWRAHEMRQLIWNGSPTTCAAFSPHTETARGFIVTGTRDGRVVVWPLPGADEFTQPLKARIISTEEVLSSGTQVRIQAEIIDNPGKVHLVVGNTATLVVKP